MCLKLIVSVVFEKKRKQKTDRQKAKRDTFEHFWRQKPNFGFHQNDLNFAYIWVMTFTKYIKHFKDPTLTI